MRSWYNAFIAKHEVAWELSFGLLAVVFVIVGQLEDSAEAASVEALLTGVFAFEFASRILATDDRRAYLRGHLIDLVALIPNIRGLRVARVLRLLRLVRMFAGIYRAMGHLTRLAQHRGLVWLFVAWGTVMVITSLAMYAAENGVNGAVESPLDALWWGVVTLTTVGYGDVVPTTPEGRLAAATLMILGIALFSAVTATVTSFMIERHPVGRPGADRLRDVVHLREDGLLTSEEYEALRAAIVGSLARE